jgi:hypothetical protein
MKRRNHLVIFVKAPELGRVKTRLAKDIGAGAALGFYRRTLAQLVLRVGGDKRWRTLLAVAPDRAARKSPIWPGRLPCVKQGIGNLGARMGRVFTRLPPGPAIIIGADIPGITRAEIALSRSSPASTPSSAPRATAATGSSACAAARACRISSATCAGRLRPRSPTPGKISTCASSRSPRRSTTSTTAKAMRAG